MAINTEDGQRVALETLVDVTTLREKLDDPTWRVVDCRHNLMAPEAGREAYRQAHIPGAVYAHLDEDLAGPITPASGRHPLPEPAELARTLGRWGINRQTQVVVYDDAGGAIAARLWWLLRWLGHRSCAVLDGGWQAWTAAGAPVTDAVPQIEPVEFAIRHGDSLAWVDEAYLLMNLHSHRDLVIDARAAPRYRGEVEPIDPVAGHVPAAVNLPFDGNLDENGRFRPPQALAQRFQAVLGDRGPGSAVHMCGSGVTACHNLLAMEVAGLTGSRLYPGSWSQWIRDPDRPVARGDE